MNAGAFGENFPYTNFHDLNLDWIIARFKEFIADNKTIHESIELLKSEIENIDINITEQIREELLSMVEDGTFAELLTNYSGFVKQELTTTDMLANNDLEAGVLVHTAGFYTPGDGGEGLFIITATHTTFELDNGLYALLLNDITNALAYGAKADGATNDTFAINNALSSSPVVRLPKKSNPYLLNQIVIPEGREIIGEETEIIANSSVLFSIAYGHTAIKNFIIRGNSYTAIEFNVLQNAQFIYINDIKAYNCLHLINDITGQDAGGNELTYTNTYIARCYGIDALGVGVHLTKAYAFIFLDDVTIDVLRTQPNAPLFYFENCRGMQIRHCEAEGGRTEGHIHQDNDGFYFKACVAIWLDRCMADTVDGMGYNIANTCEYIYLSQCVASLCGSHAFSVSGRYMTFTNCFANGNVLEEHPLQNIHGFNIYGDAVIAGCRSVGFTGAGICVHNTGVVSISAVMESYCEIGILAEPSAQGVITGCMIHTTTTGTQDIPSTLHLANNLINNVFE